MSADNWAEDAKVAEDYYDSGDADAFYFEIWGGEDIHVGMYDDVGSPPIREASVKTVAHMAEMLPGLGPDTKVLDSGAGYGGSARYLAREYGAHTVCVNISEIQNDLNRKKNAEQGLEDKVEVVHGSFDDLPAEDSSFDVVWSQDAFLHGADRDKIIAECARVLKPGGYLIFTDPMQADDAPADKLEPILNRIHLPSMGSVAFYKESAARHGLEPAKIEERPELLARHYASVRQQLEQRRDQLKGKLSDEFLDRMHAGLGHWVDGAGKGWLNWGFLMFKKPE